MWGFHVSLTLAIIVIAVFGGCAGKQVVCLEVFSEGPEILLAQLPIQNGETFTLEFINSIYRAPVRETLVYEQSEGVSIIMVESPSGGVFEYYGLEPDGTGKALLHRKVGDFKIRSHDYTNHRLTVGGQTLQLKGLSPDGEPAMVRVRARAECDMRFFWR